MIAEMVIGIGLDAAGLSSGVAKAEGSLGRLGASAKRIGGGMKKAGMAMSLGITGPLLLLGKMGVDELGQMETATAQTVASIKRLGAGTMVTVKSVESLAGALQKKSGIDDQIIQTGANHLLTLGAINTKTKQGAAIFKKAAVSMVDFAEATGTDAAGAGRLYAKSLAAASEGTLLLPKGVKLGAAGMAKLKKSFEGASSAAERQQLVVDALGAKFKGSAVLTSAERFDVVKDRVAGLAAGFVQRLLPAFEKVTAFANKLMDRFDKLSPGAKSLVAKIVLLAGVMGPLLMVLGSVVTAAGAVGGALAAIGLPVIAVVAAIALLVAGFLYLYKTNEGFRKGVQKAWANIKTAIVAGIAIARAAIASFVAWAQAFWEEHGARITATVQAAFALIAQYVKTYIAVVKNIIGAVMDIVRGDWEGAWAHIKAAAKAAWDGIKKLIPLALKFIGNYLRMMGPLWKGILQKVWEGIKTMTRNQWESIKNLLGLLARGAVNLALANLRAVIGGVALVWKGIRMGVSAAWGFIKGAVVAAAEGLVSAAVGAVNDIIGKVTGVWTGIRNGVSAAWGFIKSAVVSAANGVVTAGYNALHGLVAKAASVGSSIKAAIIDAINGVIRAWNGLKFELPSLSIKGKEVFGGATISTPDIGELGGGSRSRSGSRSAGNKNVGGYGGDGGGSGSTLLLTQNFYGADVNPYTASQKAVVAFKTAGFVTA